MLIALILGTIIGMVLAIPPGPVAVTAMRLSLDKGFRPSVVFGAAAGIMDFLYCAFAIFSTSAVMDAIGSISEENPNLQLAFQAVVIISITLYGIYQFKKRPESREKAESLAPENGAGVLKSLGSNGPFLLGVAIALANVANPTFLPTLMYLMVYVGHWKVFESSFVNNMSFAVGFGLGNFLWLFALGRMMNKWRDRMSDGFIRRIYQFAGVTLVGFGALLGYRVFFPKIAELWRLALVF